MFGPLLDLLAEVPDPRRAQGKLYSLPHVLLFSIFAIVTGCNSSRGIVTFIDVHRRKLNVSMPARIRCYLLMLGLTAAFHDGALDCPGRP